MSGGSYDYVFGRVDDAADAIARRHHDSPLHLAFCAHLRLVAKALHAVEWMDSGDTEPGEDAAAMTVVLGGTARADAAQARVLVEKLDALVAQATELRARLEAGGP